MRLSSVSLAALVCLVTLTTVSCSTILSNELFKLKLSVAGKAVGAASVTGFTSGLLAGAAYLHHKKYHTAANRVHDHGWKASGHESSHYPVVNIHDHSHSWGHGSLGHGLFDA